MRYEKFATTWKLIPASKKLWRKDENLKNFIKIIFDMMKSGEERRTLEKAVFELGVLNARMLKERNLGVSDIELVEIFLLLHGIETWRSGNKIIAKNCLFEATFEISDMDLCSKLYEGFSSVISVDIKCSCSIK